MFETAEKILTCFNFQEAKFRILDNEAELSLLSCYYSVHFWT